MSLSSERDIVRGLPVNRALTKATGDASVSVRPPLQFNSTILAKHLERPLFARPNHSHACLTPS
jgi:hypothetical protein